MKATNQSEAPENHTEVATDIWKISPNLRQEGREEAQPDADEAAWEQTLLASEAMLAEMIDEALAADEKGLTWSVDTWGKRK